MQVLLYATALVICMLTAVGVTALIWDAMEALVQLVCARETQDLSTEGEEHGRPT